MTRCKLPNDRHGKTKAVNIGGLRVYIQTGEYEDGSLGEIFLKIGKHGNELRSYDAVAIMTSLALQNGVPLAEICEKMIGHDIEPNGVTDDPQIPFAKSIIDYAFKWLKQEYIDGKK